MFGWKVLDLPAGAMWALPGYGDHLEECSPACASRWRRWAPPTASSTSSPPLNPIAADDADTPPHWSVTFGVDDADATAAKVRELGGEVLAGPFDAPWTRMAVVKDPQGATFVASQFVAENKDLPA